MSKNQFDISERRWRKEELPFRFDGTRRSGLSDQLADGLRQAILTGRIKPGETLPTILEWAKILDVSIRVPEAAIARLVSEGLIIARRRRGCVVAERGNAPNWQGHVLVVVPDDDACYYSNVQLGCVRARLSAAGYLVTSLTVLRKDGEQESFDYDLAPLEFALRQSVDLVVLVFNYRRTGIARTVARSGVPFVEFADAQPCRIKGCVGSVCLDKATAMRRLEDHCRAVGVSRVTQVGAYTSNYDANFFRRMEGVKFSNWRTERNIAEYGVNESMVRGAMESFQRRLSEKGRNWLPELFYLTDDHVASGALMAMLEAGIRIPDDVRVVTMANWGLGPVFPVALTRLEMNPYAHGDALAQMALDYLKHKMHQGLRFVQLQYIEGASL